MEVMGWFRILRRRWRLTLLLVLLAVGAAAAGNNVHGKIAVTVFPSRAILIGVDQITRWQRQLIEIAGQRAATRISALAIRTR